MHFEQHQFFDSREKFEQLMQRWEKELEDYAKTPNAKPSYIDRENSKRKNIMDYYEASNACVKAQFDALENYPVLKRELKEMRREYQKLEILAKSKGVDTNLAKWIVPEIDRGLF